MADETKNQPSAAPAAVSGNPPDQQRRAADRDNARAAADREGARQSDAERTIADGRRRQQEGVDRQNRVEAESKPTPSQDEIDRARLGLPVEIEPSGLPIDTSVHPTDALRERMVPDDASFKTRDSGSR